MLFFLFWNQRLLTSALNYTGVMENPFLLEISTMYSVKGKLRSLLYCCPPARLVRPKEQGAKNVSWRRSILKLRFPHVQNGDPSSSLRIRVTMGSRHSLDLAFSTSKDWRPEPFNLSEANFCSCMWIHFGLQTFLMIFNDVYVFKRHIPSPTPGPLPVPLGSAEVDGIWESRSRAGVCFVQKECVSVCVCVYACV